MAGRDSTLRSCGMVVGVFVALVLAMVGVYKLHNAPAPEPDVEKAAHSGTTQAGDKAVTAQVDSRIDQVRAALPWATYLGTSIVDYCDTGLTPSRGERVNRISWIPVTCTRTDTLYEAFDGDFRQHLVRLDSALDAAGWHLWNFSRSIPQGEKPGLASTFDGIHTAPAGASQWQLQQAAHQPNEVSLGYTAPITQDFTPPADPDVIAVTGAHPTGGFVEVAQAPHLPAIDEGRSRVEAATRDPLRDRKPTTYIRARQAYSPAGAYPAHGAVIAVQFSISYGTSPAGS